MKKLFMLLLTAVAALTLSACGGNEDIECEANEFVVDGECVGLDNIEDLNSDQIAELIMDEFDGGLGHLGTAMSGMNFDESSELVIEGTIAVIEDGTTMNAHVKSTQKTAMIDGKMAYYQKQEITVDEMTVVEEMISVEVEGGMDLYFNVGGFLDALDMQEKAEATAYLDAFNLGDEWLMFHFEDSLENMVELEVAKDFILEILEDEFGMNPFVEMQEQLELDSEIDFDAYNFNLVEIGVLLEANDYAGIGTYLENVDFIGLQEELMDMENGGMVVAPPLVDPIELEEALLAMDHAAFLEELETFDFEMMVTKVSEGETAFEAYVAGLNEFPEIKALLTPMVPIVGALEEEDVLDEIAFIAERMSDFEEYFTYQYYIDEEFLAVSAEIVDGDNILTTATIDPTNFDNVFEDFVTDLYWFMYEFPNSDLGYVENLNCPSSQTCEEFDAISEVADVTANLDSLTVEFLYDPSGDKSMSMTLDAADFLQSIADEDEYASVTFNTAEISVSMSEGATITVPSNAGNVQDAIDELVMLGFMESIQSKVRTLQNELGWNPVPDGTYTLETYPQWHRFDTPAFDQDMSTIVIAGGEATVTLYWRDGSMVLDSAVTHEELEMLWEDNMYDNSMTRTKLLNVIGEINAADFSTGKAVVYMMFD